MKRSAQSIPNFNTAPRPVHCRYVTTAAACIERDKCRPCQQQYLQVFPPKLATVVQQQLLYAGQTLHYDRRKVLLVNTVERD